MLLVVDADADRAVLVVVGKREEDVFLSAVTDQEASQRSFPQHPVSVFHSEGAPVKTAELKLGRCVRDDLAVLLGGEGAEVSPVAGLDG